MRISPIMAGLAIALATTAQAQQSVSPPSEDAVSGEPAPAAAASPLGQPSMPQMAPPQEVAQAAPPPAQSYPPCTKGVTDSCRNPDPKKELPYYRPADTPS